MNIPIFLRAFGDKYDYTNAINNYNSCFLKNRCKSNNHLASNDPASLFQKQKLIQNTVRVPSSLFTMNLASLSSYQSPQTSYNIVNVNGTPYVTPPKVYWNQMSDRKIPHMQMVKTNKTRLQPGYLSPGGSGVDIKHNSYNRYLNKIKAKSPLRQGTIPDEEEIYSPFNNAYPTYGGKFMKTSIINNCICPDAKNKELIYKSNQCQEDINNITYTFNIGDIVWAKTNPEDLNYQKATIININSETNTITVKFTNGNESNVDKCDVLIYFDCTKCNYITGKEISIRSVLERVCILQDAQAGGAIFPTDDGILKGYNYFI